MTRLGGLPSDNTCRATSSYERTIRRGIFTISASLRARCRALDARYDILSWMFSKEASLGMDLAGIGPPGGLWICFHATS
jgi:hypothetical protein